MRAELTLRMVAFDTQRIQPGATSATFFSEKEEGQAESVATRSEPLLVRWLTSDFRVRDLLLSELELSRDAWLDTEIRFPFIVASNCKPGDIDLLACERGCPQFATAIEWKRVKVRCDGDTEKVNRLEGLGKATDQLEGLHALGFHKTYLGVIVIVDGSASNTANVLCRGSSITTCERVIDMAGLSIPDKAGLLYVEIVQPLRRSIDDAATASIGMIRPAVPRQQRAELSSLVGKYLSAR